MKLFLALAALAAPAMGAHHPLPAYVNGWRQGVAAVRDDAQVTVTLVVKEQGAEAIRRVALAVSDPASKSYGEFLTTQQVAALTAPKSDDMNAVTSWLESNGVGFQVRHSNVVASMSVADASKLFSTKFHLATHNDQPKPLLRAAAFALPEEVEASVATVFGLHGLPLPRRQAVVVTSQDPSYPAKVTPEVLNSFYGISGVETTRSDKNKQAIAEFEGQFMNSTDLATLFKTYVKNYEVGTDDVVSKWVGKHEETNVGVGAEVDIQYIMGQAVGIKTEFWEFPGMDFGADLNQWTSNLTTVAGVPIVHSVSYGWQGDLSQIHVLQKDVDVIDANLAKCAAMGISIMVSSGNAGSGYAPGAPPRPKKPVLWASWPASSPWVTAVGATRFIGQKVGNEEMASDQFGSGGGFSTTYDQSNAKYQAPAVAKYLKTVEQDSLPPAGSFDPLGRATPDVSVLGEGYQVVINGRVVPVGAGASSPVFASMVSMLNEARFAAGKKQMGFLNPFLYSNEGAFTDVVAGSNKVDRGGQPLPYGFNCSKGWDPVTGLGTPLFQKLLKAALA